MSGQRTDHNAHTQHHTRLLYNGVSAGNTQRQGHNTARLTFVARLAPAAATVRDTTPGAGSVNACLVQLRMTVMEHAETMSQDVLRRLCVVLLCCCAVGLLCCCVLSVVLSVCCVVVLLCCCAVVLLCCCAVGLLCCRSVVLLSAVCCASESVLDESKPLFNSGIHSPIQQRYSSKLRAV